MTSSTTAKPDRGVWELLSVPLEHLTTGVYSGQRRPPFDAPRRLFQMNVPSAEALAAGTIDNCFNAAAEHIERYMIEGATVGNGAAVFATWHLMTRSLVDLRAGQFLASEGRPIQMASVIRPVLEGLNLVELFAREPEAAD